MEFVVVPLKLGVVSTRKGCSVVWDSQSEFTMGLSDETRFCCLESSSLGQLSE